MLPDKQNARVGLEAERFEIKVHGFINNSLLLKGADREEEGKKGKRHTERRETC